MFKSSYVAALSKSFVVVITIGTLSLIGQSHAVAQDCGTGNVISDSRATEILDAVNTNDFTRLRDVVGDGWAIEGGSGRRIESLKQLGRLMLRTDNISASYMCESMDGTRVDIFFKNSMTGATDKLWASFDSTDNSRYTNIQVRFSVNAQPGDLAELTRKEKLQYLDAFIGKLNEAGFFSGTVLIAHKNKILFEKSYGLADREQEIPFSTDSLFNLASLNKIFTATAVLQLVEEGKISITERLSDILPDRFPSDTFGAIQIQHLLSHTSGISGNEERIIFTPGTDFSYSNTGYGILGDVIEVKSGVSYKDYLRLFVLGPLGMARTGSHQVADFTHALVTGYEEDIQDEQLITGVPNPWLQRYPGGPVGGYYSTARELLSFAVGLQEGKMLSQSTVQLMRAPKAELGTDKYGFGVILWKGPGIWGHAGDLPGAEADLEIYGDGGYLAIVLANMDQVNEPVLTKIRSLYFPQSLKK